MRSIAIVRMKTTTQLVPVEGRFAFKPTGSRWKVWLQRKLWAWLRHTEAVREAYDSVETVHRLPTDGPLLDEIRLVWEGIYRRYGRPPTRLFLGHAKEYEFLDTIIRAQPEYGVVDLGVRKEFMGMHVEIVPHMDGWLVLP